MPTDSALRTHVLNLLNARQAHCTFERAVTQMPPDRRGERPEDLPYSVWELVEHVRRAQRDILEYCQDAEYEEQSWPDDYWPDDQAPPSEHAWKDAVTAVEADRKAISNLVRNDRLDLYETVPSSTEHTYLREFLLVADHNAYHIGQIVAVRRSLDLWPPEDH